MPRRLRYQHLMVHEGKAGPPARIAYINPAPQKRSVKKRKKRKSTR
jgi:hypothetical protein